MSQLSFALQEVPVAETTITILSLLQMDGLDRRRRRRRSLKERLGLKGIGCCGPSWGFGPTTISVREDDDDDEYQEELQNSNRVGSDSIGVSSGMNLAAALAAERHFRSVEGAVGDNDYARGDSVPGTPLRVSLMRLLEETDGEDGRDRVRGALMGSDTMCCVCMGSKKGAAFIPCGHTFCRVCSRELWLNRGSCPLCNRSILEILDIY